MLKSGSGFKELPRFLWKSNDFALLRSACHLALPDEFNKHAVF